MELYGSFCFVLFLMITGFVSMSESYNFYVGGKDGWVLNPSESYDHWAQRNRFSVNDSLVFKLKEGSDSVLVVNKDDYYKCNTQNPIKKMTNGESVFKLDRSGPFFFISGNKNGTCEKGQKLILIVLAVRPHKPPVLAPPPQKGMPPVSTPPPSLAPRPSMGPVSPSPSATPPVSTPSPTLAPGPSMEPVSPSPSATPPSSILSPSLAPGPSMGPLSPSSSPTSATPPVSTPSPTLAPGPSASDISPTDDVGAAPAPSTSSARRVLVATPWAFLVAAVTLVLS